MQIQSKIILVQGKEGEPAYFAVPSLYDLILQRTIPWLYWRDMHAKTLEAGAGVTCNDFPAKWTRIFQLHIISI